MSAAARDPADELSPEAVQFALAFDRLSPADQRTVARMIDLLTDEQTRRMVEIFVMASCELDDVQDAVPGLRSTH